MQGMVFNAMLMHWSRKSCVHAAAISMQHTKLSSRLGLCPCLERLEHRGCFILHSQQHKPHEATHIVDEEEEVPLASQGR
jgi:hypothetical protein